VDVEFSRAVIVHPILIHRLLTTGWVDQEGLF